VAVTAHFFDKFQLNHLKSGQANLASDTLKVGLITSGTYAWNGTSQVQEFVSDLLGGSGAGALTEVSTSGTGYTRQSLTSVTYTQATTVVTLTCANPSWAASTFSASYAFFYDETNSSATDASRPLVAYWDLGGAQSVAAGTFTLTISGSGLVTWTAS